LAPKWARFAEARNVRAGGADPPRGRRLPVFMRMGAHRAHELLSPKLLDPDTDSDPDPDSDDYSIDAKFCVRNQSIVMTLYTSSSGT
jgi:hypothetical protein